MAGNSPSTPANDHPAAKIATVSMAVIRPKTTHWEGLAVFVAEVPPSAFPSAPFVVWPPSILRAIEHVFFRLLAVNVVSLRAEADFLDSLPGIRGVVFLTLRTDDYCSINQP
jgi:hypothetical protein